MHTGSATVPMPSLGSWLSYGLGTLNSNLPPYVVICEHLPYAGSQVWDSNFLPPDHQGTRILPGEEPVANLKSLASTTTLALPAKEPFKTMVPEWQDFPMRVDRVQNIRLCISSALNGDGPKPALNKFTRRRRRRIKCNCHAHECANEDCRSQMHDTSPDL